MKLLLIMLVLLSVAPLYAQVYNNPGGSITTCSGTFYDSGGAGGNYGDNQNITTTFCATAGQQLMFDFTSINIENGFDYINVYNGSSTASPLLGYISGVGTAQVFSTNGCLTFQFISDNSFNYSGWVANISCFTPADYTHPTTGIANEFVGSCIVNNCGPFTYTDNGGPAGNYSNSIGSTLYGGIYRVFCPSVAGSCMRATFNQYSTEAGYDYMTIGNGPTQNSPFFTTTPANALGRISGAPTVPFTYTSTDQSGCLTFRFLSDGINNAPGWNATLQCVPCAGGPTGLENSDCINSTAVCSNSSITALSHGPGLVSEYCNGTSCPAGGENYSNWYQFIPQTSGNLSINIVPTNPLDDFDFFIFQANSCSSLDAPIRCSDAGTTGATGATGTTGAANLDLSESVTGNGVVQQLNVTAGQRYYLVVDKWSPDGTTGYTVSFTGISLNCTILGLDLLSFDVEYQSDINMVDLIWVTNNENNMSHFDVERSVDGEKYELISRVKAIGNTNYETQYLAVDNDPIPGVNYYRLNMFDFDGTSKYSDIRVVNVLDDMYDILTLFPNPTTELTEVIFNSYSTEEAYMQLTDATGKIISKEGIPVVKGGNRMNMDLSAQAAGVYVLTIVTKHKTHRTKLIKE